MENNNIDLIKNLTESPMELNDIKEEKPLINDVKTIVENNEDVKNDASAVSLTSLLPVQAKKRKRKINPNKIKRRRRYIEGQPKAPLTGYVRYMSEKREQLKVEFPNKTAIEHTKIIAEYWNRMSDEEKNPYLKAADLERVKYLEELEEFKKQKSLTAVATEEGSGKDSGQENRNPQNGQQKQQINGGAVDGPKKIAKDIEMYGNNNKKRRVGDDGKGIPIFTDEFLEHNKNIDAELRILRKSNGDYEQQNSVLEKHIENMKFGLEKLENENQELEEKNRLFQAYLDKLKIKLITALSGLELDELNGATVENIDKYMNELLANANTHNLSKAKDVMRKLDLHIQL